MPCPYCLDRRHCRKAEDIYGDGVLRHWLKVGDGFQVNRPCHESTDHGFTTPSDKWPPLRRQSETQAI